MTQLKQCWDAMVTYKNNKVWKKSAEKVAQEERTYWLAKRAFQGWSSQMDKMTQKNNLYTLLKTHYAFTLKKKAILSLRNFTNFKMERRYNDLVVMNNIVQLRKSNVFDNWRRVQLKRQAVKRLTFHSEKAIKAIVLRNMIESYNYQNSVTHYVQSQRSVYVKLTAFNRLQQAVVKRKSVENAQEVIADRKDYWALKKTFMCWFNKYKTIQRNYKIYAF